ncbi:YhdP family protein [Motilimonas cestriensis]|uniref:YhdP family protein n=1 Tax=Motilimonas cestriensis TaxID=2742685 RepID=UPI003DA586EB
MRQFSLRWLRRFWLGFAIVLVLFTIAISLFRAMLPMLNSYKDDLSAWLLTEHQLNIQLDSLDATWDNYGPALVVLDTTWLPTSDEPFDVTIAQTRIRVDLLKSVQQKQWVFSRIALSGVKLNLYLDRLGATDSSPAPLNSQVWQSVLLEKIQDFVILDSQVVLHSELSPSTVFSIAQLSWLNLGERHQGVGKGRIGEAGENSSFNFILDIKETSSPLFSDWLGQLFVEGEQLNLVPLLAGRVAEHSELLAANVNFKGWADFSFKGINSAQLHIQPSQLLWQSQQQAHQLTVNSGVIKWWPTAAGWQIDGSEFSVSSMAAPRDNATESEISATPLKDTSSLLNSRFNFQLYQHDDFLVGSLGEIEFAPFLTLGSLFADSISTRDNWWVNAQPMAKATSSQVLYQMKSNQYLAHSLISDINLKANAGLPSLQDATVQLLGSELGGRLSLSLADTQLDFAQQFQAPIQVGRISVPLRWTYGVNGPILSSDSALFSNQDLAWQGRFKLDWSDGGSPYLSLYSEANLKRASEADKYFPIQLMGENVYDYLQPTIAAGEVETAKILWHGRLDQYPYEKGEGVFQAWVPLTNTEFHFYPGWPPLSEMKINLLFQNAGLFLESSDATLMKARSNQITGAITRFAPDANLTINAKVQGFSRDISEYLQASPLADSVGAALKKVVVAGPITGELKLEIPLNGDPAKVAGAIALNDNKVNIPLSADAETVLSLSQVTGQFEFDQGNLNNGSFKANWQQQPVTVRFSGEEQADTYLAKVNVLADWPANKLDKQWPALQQLDLSGKLSWQANLNYQSFAQGGYRYDLQLSSDTLGLGIGLPAPMNKNSLRGWPLSINLAGSEKGTELDAELDSKLFIRASVNAKNATESRWWLHLGQTLPSQMPERAKAVSVALNQLDLDPWLAWAQQQNWPQSGTSQSDWIPDFIKVNINEMQFWQQAIHGLSLSARRDQQQWSLTLASDKGKGKIVDTPNLLLVDLQRLYLPDLLVPSAGKNDPPSPWSWQHLKNTQLSCQKCQIGNINLGQVQGQFTRHSKGIKLDNLSLLYGHSDVHMTGDWSGESQQKTQLNIAIQSQNIARFAQTQGYDSPMKETSGVADFELSWLGSPNMFNTESLNGKVKLATNTGYIADVSDKGARLFSLLSLDSIRRKLNLDFRDVFVDGLYFDSIKTTANITNGLVNSDDFTLDAAAGRLQGKGQLDLNRWQMDYRMSFYPDVTSSLPVLAAFTLTPVTGLYVLLLSKIFEPVVDVIAEVNFSLKGDISNPEISEIGREKGVVELPKEIKESYEQRITDSVDKLQQIR